MNPGLWDGTPQASQFQPTGRGLDALFQRIAAIEKRLRDMSGANILGAANVTVDKQGITIASKLTVLGQLALPAGIIGNDALANPVQGGSGGLSASGYGLSSTQAAVVSTTILVPTGFTRALVHVTCDVAAYNTTGASQYLYVAASINGTGGGESTTPIANGVAASGYGSAIRSLSGLTPGGTFSIAALARTGGGTIAAAGANLANLNAIALFLR